MSLGRRIDRDRGVVDIRREGGGSDPELERDSNPRQCHRFFIRATYDTEEMKVYLIIIIVFLKDRIVDFSSENVNTISVSFYNPNPKHRPPTAICQPSYSIIGESLLLCSVTDLSEESLRMRGEW